jgi:proteasome lid subunit RPN8/RPN11
MKTPFNHLILPLGIIQTILEDVESGIPEEVCGLLSGKGSKVQRQFSITNTFHSPDKFFMDGQQMLAAFNWMEQQNQELLAIYHSHPNGPATPSETDLAEDYYPMVVKIIVSKEICDWQVKGYIINGAAYQEVPIINGENDLV